MAFNVSSLPQYVDQSSNKLIVETLFGSQTAKLLKDAGSIQLGVKGSAAVQLMNVDSTIQSGAACGRSAAGSANFSQAIITVVPLKDEQNFCNKDLENKWMVEFLTKGQTYSEALFANEIMSARASKIAQELEIGYWKGDVSITGTSNYNKFDGFSKKIKAGAKITLGAVAGTTIVEKLQNIFLGMPSKIRTADDFRIFIGADIMGEYTVALANKNIFKPVDDLTLFGTTAKLAVVDGLNSNGVGVNREVFAGRLRSFVLGADLLGEEEKATMYYSPESQNVYMDFHFSAGVVPIYVSEIGYATV